MQIRGGAVKHDEAFVDKVGRHWPKIPPHITGFKGLCPRCAQGKMFDGFLKLQDRCPVCDLDYSFADPADGPAVFVQLIACVPGVVFILLFEVFKSPPLWMHLAISLPIALLSTLGPLRPVKGWLVASQFYYSAEEGRLAGRR